MGVNVPSGLLLDGKPGVGKTTMANCFIKASGRPAFICRKDKSNGDFVKSIKECFEKAIEINPIKPEGYVLLAQTLQLMSGYDNTEYRRDAEENYRKAMEIYQQENLLDKVEDMKRQLKHLNSSLSFK